MTRTVQDYLKTLPRFRGIGDTELMGLVRCTRPRELSRLGEVLFEEGDPGDAAYIVQRGLLNVELPMPDGSSRLVAQLGPGTMVGELCLIEDAPRSMRVRAAEPTLLVAIDRAAFDELRRKGHSGAYKLIRSITLTVCDRLRNTNLQIRERLDGVRSATTEMEVVRPLQPNLTPQNSGTWDRLRALFGRG